MFDNRIVLNGVGEALYRVTVTEATSGAQAQDVIDLVYRKHLSIEATRTSITCNGADDATLTVTTVKTV